MWKRRSRRELLKYGGRYGYGGDDFDGLCRGNKQHILNKNESKTLRRLMSETGLTEEELRKHKKYRIQLSIAQKKRGKGKSDVDQIMLMELKRVLRELKLPKEHPKVFELFKRKIIEYNNKIRIGYSFARETLPTEKASIDRIIRMY